ncbi:MAG: UDP-N-acetyl-D-glucosamine dehydrogenase [Phycisphaerae bacterium]|nr:UDP-N-acetyl-D-glucosamine dehydrogenase [Phycisphaerae bacterium]
MTQMSSDTATRSQHAQELMGKIEQRTAVVGIVGLGYVGLPLARAVMDAGYPVLGYDTDGEKIDALDQGRCYIEHLGDEFFNELRTSEAFSASSDPQSLAGADLVLLCVPTPLGSHNEPDLGYVLDSTRMVSKILRPGQLVVLESTTYPGTTRQEMMPLLLEGGLECGKDFFLAYSPEREDPGSPGRSAAVIPKLVGGVDETSGDLAFQFYSNAVASVHKVSTAEVAESAKLLENIYRAVNIALVNEMKTVLTDMDVDIWEVIDAAATKPFGFQAFYPGPGLGGHCIPIDPFYLSWKAKEIGRHTHFIELAGEINTSMPLYVIDRLAEALNTQSKPIRGSRVLVMGIAYKPNVDDARESPAAEIMDLLAERGAIIEYHDPHLPTFPRMRNYDLDMKSVRLDENTVKSTDVVLIVTDHDAVDYDLIGEHASLIVDTRNAMSRAASIRGTLVKA